MAGENEGIMEGADLIRKVIAFGRKTALMRASAEPVPFSNPDDPTGFFIPSGERQDEIPLKIHSLLPSSNHVVQVVETPQGERWVTKRDFLFSLPFRTTGSCLPQEAKILQQLNSKHSILEILWS
jgi:hypothetical protein